MQHEWGAGVIGYAVAMNWGGAGILLLRDALALALAIVAVRTALRIGASPLLVMALAPVAMLLVENGYLPVRAQAYSFLLTALTLAVCERDREGAHGLMWALVPLFALWANLHAAFAFGMILLVVYAGERAVLQRGPWIHVGVVLFAIVAVIRVNPYGWGYYGHLLRSISLDRSLVPEWDPLWLGSVPVYQKMAYCVAVGLAAYGLAFGRGHRRSGVLLLAATTGASALHCRMLPFFGTAWIIYCPGLLQGSLLHDVCTRLFRHRRAVLLVSVAISLVTGVQIWHAAPLHLQVPNEPVEGNPKTAPYYPVGAVAYLKEHRFHGNLLTPFNHGSYVLWKLYPAVKVSLDSRYEEAYEPSMAEDLIRLYQTGEGLPAVLERYRPDAILVPRDSGLANAPIPLPQVYEDASFRVYARPGAPLRPAANVRPLPDQFP